MTKIIRKKHFFKQYQNLILGTLWIMVATSYFLVSENSEISFNSVLYLVLGLLYFTLYFFQKERNHEFIAWNEEQIILSQWQYKPEMYSIEEISNITITNSHFILNLTVEEKGKTMELSGYSENDLNLLRSRFSPDLAI